VSKGAVLISGAAGGIGIATVDQFLESGYVVAGIDLSPSVKSLRPEPYRGVVADVTKPAELAAAIDEVLDGLELRHVVGLAGGLVQDELDVLLADDPVAATAAFDSSLSLNLSGQFSLVHATLPRLDRIDGNRSITLCSSVNAMRGYGAPAYSAAKAGIIGMMHALATPLGHLGVRINVVAPGTTRTPALDDEVARAGDPGIVDRRAEEIPLQRVAEPADVAVVIESVADRLTYVSDDVLQVDGGQLLARPVDRTPNRGMGRWRRAVRRRLQNRSAR
jgi:NAD(P)-dependent dehydrogenase (short-subunit alcohol dehydrogenase family)